ncbi:MAG: NTP transferase domain-containing protein [Bacteroidetes bacterium]|nr:NTP transferase domain-containing protein [Bacteroidota bacterium]MBK9672975.1 NTP transferase domain-containing protein [Bacteroidota bacterium]MBK9799173.1 NTP transferase domain-containing protein [Bacteroidota bacterium]MBP6412270.1 NTP transferase domain-containing protein [Bacteroidia bacterium]
MKNNYCVIMAGGIGSRFWPMSRTNHPKQFIDILGTGETLLQQTYRRFLKLCPKENIFIVTNEIYKDLVHQQIKDISDDRVLLEPARRNTAPCIAYACFKIAKINSEANIVVAPSDHLILKEHTFVKAIQSCFKKAASEDCLVTLGIKPTRPDTGYGYIQFKQSEAKESDARMKKVKTFTEKPDLEMAKFFRQSGDFLWNAGIFIWTAKSVLLAFEKHMIEMYTLFNDGISKLNTPEEAEFIKQTYPLCKNISIDYGIMEKADNVYVRSSAIGWSDLGTWGSLYQHMDKEEKGNAIVGKNVLMYNSKNCIVHVPKNKLVVLEGLADYIVVESDDVLLVCKKSEEQQIRQFVNDVKSIKGDKFV